MNVQEPNGQYTLPPKLNLSERREFFEFLEAHRCTSLSIDFSQLSRIGALGAQMLLAAKQTWKADQIDIEFNNIQPEVTSNLKRLGLHDILIDNEEQK